MFSSHRHRKTTKLFFHNLEPNIIIYMLIIIIYKKTVIKKIYIILVSLEPLSLRYPSVAAQTRGNSRSSYPIILLILPTRPRP